MARRGSTLSHEDGSVENQMNLDQLIELKAAGSPARTRTCGNRARPPASAAHVSSSRHAHRPRPRPVAHARRTHTSHAHIAHRTRALRQAVFDRADRDGGGSLDLTEFLDAFGKVFGKNLAREQVSSYGVGTVRLGRACR